MGRVLIGEMLLHERSIDEVALAMALRHQSDFGGRLGDILVGLRFVTEAQLVEALGRQLRLRVVELGNRTVPPAVLRLVPEHLLRRHTAFPVGFVPEHDGGRHHLVVAFADPQDVAAVDEIQFAAGMPIRAVLAGKRDIAHALFRHLGGAPLAPLADVARRPEPIELHAADELEPMLLVDVRETRNFRRVAS